MTGAPIGFDDVDALAAASSETFSSWSDPLEVTQAMIHDFAELTGDRQWIHVDVERAQAESPFGGPVAHGFLTLSLLPRLYVRPVEISGYSSAVNYGAEMLRFLAPVPAGSSIRGRSRLIGARRHERGGTLVTTETEIRVIDAQKPALLYRMQVLYR